LAEDLLHHESHRPPLRPAHGSPPKSDSQPAHRGVSIYATRTKLLRLLDVWAHPALIALKGCFDGLLLSSCWFVVSVGKLAGQNVSADERQAGAETGQRTRAIT